MRVVDVRTLAELLKLLCSDGIRVKFWVAGLVLFLLEARKDMIWVGRDLVFTELRMLCDLLLRGMSMLMGDDTLRSNPVKAVLA